MKHNLYKIYKKLLAYFGPQHWWPGETPFEVAVGAILTQNTNWGNVEKAINNLKQKKILDPHILHGMPVHQLADIIRPAGYFNIKSKRLKNFIRLLIEEYAGNVKNMKLSDHAIVREKLLCVNGIGPETADSILLYALGKPVFVIDAYTRRVLSRHGIIGSGESYTSFQDLFHSTLKEDVKLFNEFHALFVRVGKEYCGAKPLCDGCPLKNFER